MTKPKLPRCPVCHGLSFKRDFYKDGIFTSRAYCKNGCIEVKKEMEEVYAVFHPRERWLMECEVVNEYENTVRAIIRTKRNKAKKDGAGNGQANNTNPNG